MSARRFGQAVPRARVVPLAVLALILAGGAAHAQNEDPPYKVLGHKMLNTSNDPFQYWLDSRMLHPNTVLIGQIQTAVDAAYQTWEDVACAYPAFTPAGLSTNNPNITDVGNPYDTFNVSAIWVTDAQDPYYQFALGGGAAAAAAVPLSYAGTLYQCDLYINAVDFKWSTLTPTPLDSLDLQTLVLHEIGHCMGLGHSEAFDDVMWPGAEYGGQRRALTGRDATKACTTFPQYGAVGSPCTTTADCMNQNLHCVKPPNPDGSMGPAMCSKGCTPTVPGGCDAPHVCKPSTLIPGSTGACLPSRGDFVTQVGAPCKDADDCGSAVGLCQPEDVLPSQFPAWDEGYCTQDCSPGSTACPAGSECIDFGGGALRCMKTCRLGTGDCRGNYTCIRVDDDTNICVSTCHSNADCGGAGYICRICDGTCVATQNVSGQIGDSCQSNDACGAGQFCLQFTGSTPTSLCSTTCSTSACTCPPGSSCHVLGDGNRYCLRDCTSSAGCAPGTQCGLLASGRACIPPCSSHSDCPVGSLCQSGECVAPNQDGGTCALCNQTDGGDITFPPKPRPDAGTGGGSGGCGCQASPSAVALILPIGLALFVIALRRRNTAP